MIYCSKIGFSQFKVHHKSSSFTYTIKTKKRKKSPLISLSSSSSRETRLDLIRQIYTSDEAKEK